jgi:hypothetical protein
MALTAEDFAGFDVTLERKPVAGVTPGVIPPPIAEQMAQAAPKALADPDFELLVTAKDDAVLKQIIGYSRAWGAQQEPKLRITKIPNRKDMPNNVARLNVIKEEDVPEDSRPGRKRR